MKNYFRFIISHGIVAIVGFIAGLYALPILTAPQPPNQTEMSAADNQAEYYGRFSRDLKGSDFLHWGEGELSVGKSYISLKGSIAPGPDYKLYLSPTLVETEDEFKALKSSMVEVGDVKTFKDFIVAVPADIDPSLYNAAIVWCESFGEFITAASYQ